MAPKSKSNNITVELQILQDNNMQLLRDFGEEWNAGANKFVQELRSMLGERQTGAVAAGGESASTPDKTAESMKGAVRSRMGGEEAIPNLADYLTNAVVPRGEASVAPQNIQPRMTGLGSFGLGAVAGLGAFPGPLVGSGSGGGSPSAGGSGIGGGIRSIFGGKHGDAWGAVIGTKVAQMMGVNEYVGAVVGGMFGDSANDISKRQALAYTGVGLGLMGAQHGYQTVMSNMGVGDAIFDPMGSSMRGATLGYDTYGWGGLPYGSEAWKYGLRTQYEAYERSRLESSQLSNVFEKVPYIGGALDRYGGGIIDNTLGRIPLFKKVVGSIGLADPHYSQDLADEAVSLTEAYGWGGKGTTGYGGRMQDTMLEVIKNMKKKHPGMDQEDMIQIMEPIRYGTESFEGAAAAIDLIAIAAKTANFELGAFTKKVISAGSAISDKTGISEPKGRVSAAAWSLATGQDPEMGISALTDQRGGYLSMATSGQGPYETFYGKKAGVYSAQGAASVLQELGDPKYWASIKNDPKAVAAARDKLAWYHLSSPELLMGMGPEVFSNLMMQGGDPLKRLEASVELEYAKTDKQRIQALRAGGISADVVDAYKRVTSGEQKIGSSRFATQLRKLGTKIKDPTSAEGKRNLAEFLIAADREKWAAKQQKEQAEGQAKHPDKVWVGITPEYADIFRIIRDQNKTTPQSNSRKHQGRGSSGQSSYGTTNKGTGGEAAEALTKMAPYVIPGGMSQGVLDTLDDALTPSNLEN